jgi:hypothetical protein
MKAGSLATAVTVALVASALLLGGCGGPPKYTPKPVSSPPVKYCNDATGHQSGAAPWIMGGTCCCTPTAELIEQYHRDSVCLDMTVDDLIKMYKDAGIVTDLDLTGTNNLDDHGPHVVKGGKSMVTPTPGTKNFEEVVSGVWEE